MTKQTKLTCQEAQRELAAGVDAPGLPAHVAACADCAAFGRDAVQLQQWAARLPDAPARPLARREGSRLPLLVVATAAVIAVVGLGYVVVSREHQRPSTAQPGMAVAEPDASLPPRQASAARDEIRGATGPQSNNELEEVDLLAIIDRARSVWLGKRSDSTTGSGVSDPLALAWLDAGSSTRTSERGGSDLVGLALDGRLDTLFSSQPSGATSRPRAGGGLR